MKQLKEVVRYFACLLMVFGIAVTSFAADSAVTYQGRKSGFDFAPGSSYTGTDLFDNFKQIMPGDQKSEVVTVTNAYKGCDYINVYMGALLHDAENNPVSPSVLAELEEDDRKGTLSELEYMHDFLNQLELTVWKGEKKDENVIYKGTPDSLEDGFEDGNVFLGSLSYDQSMTLNVELAVDIEMGNEYADRIGEVDWVFVIEERDEYREPGGWDPVPGPNRPGQSDKPDSSRVEVIEPISPGTIIPGQEAEEGEHLGFLPKTGDETVVWPYVLIGCVALLGLVVLIGGRRREKKAKE